MIGTGVRKFTYKTAKGQVIDRVITECDAEMWKSNLICPVFNTVIFGSFHMLSISKTCNSILYLKKLYVYLASLSD